MGNIGIIKFVKFILSFKHGRDFTAFLLFVIAVEAMVIGYQNKQVNNLNKENKAIVQQSNEKLIDFLTKQNEDYSKMKQQVDSAKAQLEIFKIKKEMR